MITTYVPSADALLGCAGFVTAEHFKTTPWIDLLDPTLDEEQHVEGLLGLDLPTREEMRVLEDSHRLFEATGAVYLTATVMVNSDSEYPRTDELTFVLAKRCLVTVRYAEPKAIALFATRNAQPPLAVVSGERALLGLLETLVERIAENIDAASRSLDDMVHRVLSPDPERPPERLDYAAMLRSLERQQILIARARASLNSLNRVLNFINRPALEFELTKSFRPRAMTMLHDIQSLVDHTSFLANNISFELAAILGMINIEQNGIIKIFSVAAVVFMPPTLVASIYGMNFRFMPELGLPFGYPWALVAMLASAAGTYGFFRRRGWL
ncbi:MAG: magnesium transporter CorA family protein [Gammaproteobacteria bacterium]|nr:magnesium transporter CorA family protein [Gammaproteobacteria bacterium]